MKGLKKTLSFNRTSRDAQPGTSAQAGAQPSSSANNGNSNTNSSSNSSINSNGISSSKRDKSQSTSPVNSTIPLPISATPTARPGSGFIAPGQQSKGAAQAPSIVVSSDNKEQLAGGRR
ncbi:hypothetical protein T439DRAFT_25991 [Meredithblackwellia eburnea MCA 4105]